jgi:hypothetical protein
MAASKIRLSVQEVEFALACKDFVAERDPSAGRQIIVENGVLLVPPSSRQAFVEFGLARLLRVMRLAVENNAISPDLIPKLRDDLDVFDEKISAAFAAISRHNRLH